MSQCLGPGRTTVFLFFFFFKLHRCELFAKELCGTWPHWTWAAATQHSPPCLHIYGCCLLQFVTQMGDQQSPANHLWLRPTFLGRFSVNDLRHIIMVRTGLGVFIYLISKLKLSQRHFLPGSACLWVSKYSINLWNYYLAVSMSNFGIKVLRCLEYNDTHFFKKHSSYSLDDSNVKKT